jgi:hypothetical protein
MDVFANLLSEPITPAMVCVVRVRTSVFGSNSISVVKRITILKRLSRGCNFLGEDIANIGAQEVYDRIENLHEVEDGVYQIITCNETHDHETGSVDDYDYRLVSYP